MQLNKNFFLTLFKCPSLFFANNNGQVNKLTPLLFCDFIHYSNSNNILLSQETELKEVAGKPKLHNTKINLSLMNEVHKNVNGDNYLIITKCYWLHLYHSEQTFFTLDSWYVPLLFCSQNTQTIISRQILVNGEPEIL